MRCIDCDRTIAGRDDYLSNRCRTCTERHDPQMLATLDAWYARSPVGIAHRATPPAPITSGPYAKRRSTRHP